MEQKPHSHTSGPKVRNVAADEYTGYSKDERQYHFKSGFDAGFKAGLELDTFQTKEAFQWLLEVLKWDKRTTDQFISDHPHIGRQLPSEKDSLNYKWTQWAKQKIENLK